MEPLSGFEPKLRRYKGRVLAVDTREAWFRSDADISRKTNSPRYR
jgi:hypothetical protein